MTEPLLTKREYYAGLAFQALMGRRDLIQMYGDEWVERADLEIVAVEHADLLIAALSGKTDL